MIVLAGGIGAGKTAAAELAATSAGATLVRVRDALEVVTGASRADRIAMQDRAALIEASSGGCWLADFLSAQEFRNELLIVDSARTVLQTRALARAFPGSLLIFLDASDGTRRSRFEAGRRSDPMKAATPFDTAMRHPTELEALALQEIADVTIGTDRLSAEQVAARIVELL